MPPGHRRCLGGCADRPHRDIVVGGTDPDPLGPACRRPPHPVPADDHRADADPVNREGSAGRSRIRPGRHLTFRSAAATTGRGRRTSTRHRGAIVTTDQAGVRNRGPAEHDPAATVGVRQDNNRAEHPSRVSAAPTSSRSGAAPARHRTGRQRPESGTVDPTARAPYRTQWADRYPTARTRRRPRDPVGRVLAPGVAAILGRR